MTFAGATTTLREQVVLGTRRTPRKIYMNLSQPSLRWWLRNLRVRCMWVLIGDLTETLWREHISAQVQRKLEQHREGPGAP